MSEPISEKEPGPQSGSHATEQITETPKESPPKESQPAEPAKDSQPTESLKESPPNDTQLKESPPKESPPKESPPTDEPEKKKREYKEFTHDADKPTRTSIQPSFHQIHG
jgi:hypothetical protein